MKYTTRRLLNAICSRAGIVSEDSVPSHPEDFQGGFRVRIRDRTGCRFDIRFWIEEVSTGTKVSFSVIKQGAVGKVEGEIVLGIARDRLLCDLWSWALES